VLRECVLGRDVVGRLGGDEFVVILERIREPQDAVVVVARILEALRRPQEMGSTELVLRTSVGIALTRGDHDTPAAALARADKAMYEAKRSHECRCPPCQAGVRHPGERGWLGGRDRRCVRE
jgi:diguanylate cyclase (GGDEF)-like protein